MASIGIGIGIEKLILLVLVLGLVLTSKAVHSQSCSRYPKETFNHLLFQTNYPKVPKTGLVCPYMDYLKQLFECHEEKSTLSIGIGIEVLGFWPVLVLVLVLKISFNQELVLVLTLGPSGVLVLVLTSGLSEVLVLVLVWPNWYCLCLVLCLSCLPRI